ncbi:hypothetical protein ACHAWF_014474 [Thalassiosira exigua]
MAGFRPAAGRIDGRPDGGARGGSVGGSRRDEDANDDLASETSSDFDRPYHETASDWCRRHARRRARRIAGISSSSSSSDECTSVESGGETEVDVDGEVGRGGDRTKRKRMERAVRSAYKPLSTWRASYPLVAARCCLPSPSVDHRSNNADAISPRDQERKRLRRIFRRLRRKQKDFQVNFIQDASSSIQQKNCHDSQPAMPLPLDRMSDQESTECESDHMAMNSFLPRGTGISFIDEALSRNSTIQTKLAPESSLKQRHTSSSLVLEVNGPPRSGMTSILLAVAARYVASTSNIFLGKGCTPYGHRFCGGSSVANAYESKIASEECPQRQKRKNCSRNEEKTSVQEPQVVILDVEKGVHAVNLVLFVREAVLRRWEETHAARQWQIHQEKHLELESVERGTKASSSRGDSSDNAMEEQRQIELAIACCLGRIHVVQPRDFTYLNLVATLEALSQSLDEAKCTIDRTEPKNKPSQQFGRLVNDAKPSLAHVSGQEQPPTLILIDSLTTLDASTRFQESLPTNSGRGRSFGGSGLSDRNEFYRQLMRIREDHEVVILGASRCAPNDKGCGALRGKLGGLWGKMVSHRITLHRVAEGTQEDQVGYDFVATLDKDVDQEGPSVFPYSVSAGGIRS